MNSKALEGFLVGNQDLGRLDALLDHFNLFEATGWYWDCHEVEGCQGIQDPLGMERDGELYHMQEMWSEGGPSQVIKPSSFARVTSSVTDNFGNLDNLSRGAPEQEKE